MVMNNVRQCTKGLLLGLSLATLLTGCIEPTKETAWIIGLDVTPSISEVHFRTMRDQMIPHLILARLRGQEVVHVLEIDSDPEDQQGKLQRLEVSHKQLALDTEIADLYAQHIQPIELRKNYRGDTNVGGVLAYANRVAAKMAATDGQNIELIVTIFTDGKLEGKQTPVASAWPNGVCVWFWGVLPEHEASLKTWATSEMQLREDQVHVVRLSDWESDAVVFGNMIERPFPDPQVMDKVYALNASAHRVAQQGKKAKQ